MGQVFGQTAGQIYKPATGDGANILDPNGTGNVLDNGINFHPLLNLGTEPTGDVRTGASGGHTDLVSSTSDDAAAYMYYDSENDALLFRVRLGGNQLHQRDIAFYLTPV